MCDPSVLTSVDEVAEFAACFVAADPPVPFHIHASSSTQSYDSCGLFALRHAGVPPSYSPPHLAGCPAGRRTTLADTPSAVAYGSAAQGQATFATGASTAVWAYSPWDSTTVTVASGLNNGTGPAAPTALTGSTLIRGGVNFGSGTTPTSGSQVTVTFSATLPSVPWVVVSPANAAAGTINPTVLAASTTGFTIGCAVTPTGVQAGTIYSVNYLMSL